MSSLLNNPAFRAGFKGTKKEDEENEIAKEFQDQMDEETEGGEKKLEKSRFEKIKGLFSRN